MAVRLRLTRRGKKKQPTYRLVAADSRFSRDGRFIETLGFYDPRQEPSVVRIDNEKVLKWLRNGAQPSERVRKLLEISGAWQEFSGNAPKVTMASSAMETQKSDEDKPAAEAAAESAELPEEPTEIAEPTEAEVEPTETEVEPAEEDKSGEAPTEASSEAAESPSESPEPSEEETPEPSEPSAENDSDKKEE